LPTRFGRNQALGEHRGGVAITGEVFHELETNTAIGA
jgi:hypothetical protein